MGESFDRGGNFGTARMLHLEKDSREQQWIWQCSHDVMKQVELNYSHFSNTFLCKFFFLYSHPIGGRSYLVIESQLMGQSIFALKVLITQEAVILRVVLNFSYYLLTGFLAAIHPQHWLPPWMITNFTIKLPNLLQRSRRYKHA